MTFDERDTEMFQPLPRILALLAFLTVIPNLDDIWVASLFLGVILLPGAVLLSRPSTIAAGLKFKFDKCNLAQLVVECLGFLIGQGVKALSPSKIHTIVVWPRPTRAA